jgi:hypothetical protein
MRKFDDETAEQKTYDIVSKVNFVTKFPGCDALELDPDIEQEKIIADAVIYAIQANQGWPGNSDNTQAFGKLAAMIAFGIVDVEVINDVLLRLENKGGEE